MKLTAHNVDAIALKQMSNCCYRCTVVPLTVRRAVEDAVTNLPYRCDGEMFQYRVTEHVALTMMRFGWRFCRCFRHEVTPAHAEIYDIVYTVGANFLADDMLDYIQHFPDKTGWTLDELLPVCSSWWAGHLRMVSESIAAAAVSDKVTA